MIANRKSRDGFSLMIFLCALLFVSSWAQTLRGADIRMAVLGDSLSTGAGTHPTLTYDAAGLWDVFVGKSAVAANIRDLQAAEPAELGHGTDHGSPFGLRETLVPPRRAWPTVREFEGGLNWVFHNAVVGLSRLYLDTEEYSWGYFVASALGVAPRQLLIAGENGARTAQIPRQLDRVLEANGGTLPQKVFLFFTGNDLCGPNLSFVTTAADYKKALLDALEYMARNSALPARGTDVYLPAFLGVLQLLNSEDILNKRIFAHGKEISCRKLREQLYRPDAEFEPRLPPEAGLFSMMMPPNPAAFCPTLFGTVPGQDRETVVGDLANRIRTYRQVQREVVGLMNQRMEDAGTLLRFHFLPSTAKLTFRGEEVGQDCFHLNPKGQGRIAAAILTDLHGS